MRKAAAIALLLTTAACGLPPKTLVPDGMLVDGFYGVNTPKDFWKRQAEIEAKNQNVALASTAYRECAAQEAVNLSPPDVNAKVDRFVKSWLYKDYYDAIDGIQVFMSDFKRQRGMEMVQYIAAYCVGKTGA